MSSESSEGASNERHLWVPSHSLGLIFLRLFQPLYLTPDDPQPRHRYRFGLTDLEPLGIGLPSLVDGKSTQYIQVETGTRDHDMGSVSCLKMTAEGGHKWLFGVFEDHKDVPGLTCTTVRIFDGDDLVAYAHMAVIDKTIPGAFSYERLTDATP